MLELIETSIAAHGGPARWAQVRQVSATLTPGGVALTLRGQAAFAKQPTRITVDTREQRARLDPFLAAGQVGQFEPYRTAVETADGAVLEELKDPRGSFKPDTPWTGPQLIHFVGYAMWTYLNLPFALLNEEIRLEEIAPWIEDGEAWRAVKVAFPKSIVTHSTEQVLYFDDKGLIRRHDYSVDIAAGGKAAHYLYDHQASGGIVFPIRRRIHPRGPDGRPDMAVTLMAADLADFELR